MIPNRNTNPGETMSKLIGIPDKEEEIGRWVGHALVPDTILHAEAAGVLPFCVVGGKVHILLGRESWRHNFPREAIGTWCDFGGSTGKRRRPIFTAAQELVEETIGSAVRDCPLGETIDYIRDNLYMQVLSSEGNKTPYAMFVVRIPYCNVPQVFCHRHRVARRFKNSDNSCLHPQRELLKRAQPYCFHPISGRVRRHYLEKDNVQWFPIESIMSACDDNSIPLRPEFAKTLVRYNILNRLIQLLKHSDNTHDSTYSDNTHVSTYSDSTYSDSTHSLSQYHQDSHGSLSEKSRCSRVCPPPPGFG